MLYPFPTRSPSRTACCSGRRRALRRGYSSIASLMYVVIGILMLMLVVNWTYLVLASRHTSRLADVLATSAATELLDDAWLRNHGKFGSATQSDDISAAKDVVTNEGTGFLRRNNDMAGIALRANSANPGEVTIIAARVPDAAQFASGANFIPAPSGTEPYNTLRVEIFRNPASPNPVLFMMRGFGSPHAAKITGAATVTLDNRVIGFRPYSVFTAPVVPIAIDQWDWFTTRQSLPLGSSSDSNGNGIRELDFEIKLSGDASEDDNRHGNGHGHGNGDNHGPGNAYAQAHGPRSLASSVLVSLHVSQNLDITGPTLPRQIREGCRASDFASGFLGVVAPAGNAKPYAAGATIRLDTARGIELTQLDETAIVTALNDVAASSYPRRVFPVHNRYSDPLTLRGFVGARVISARIRYERGAGNDHHIHGNHHDREHGQAHEDGKCRAAFHRIVVRLEPDFIVHSTVETQTVRDDHITVPENIYLHKTRLTR
jgi:hypothetical protein